MLERDNNGRLKLNVDYDTRKTKKIDEDEDERGKEKKKDERRDDHRERHYSVQSTELDRET